MNVQAITKAMFEAKEEYKTCKRNKTGTLNQNAAGKIRDRLADKIQEAGETRHDAWQMVWELDKKQS